MPTTLLDSTWQCLDPGAIYQACSDHNLDTSSFYGKANSFRMTRGETPGRGWILLPLSTVVKLNFSTLHSLLFADDNLPPTLITNLLILRAYSVTPGADNDPATAYLVELADARWFACNATWAQSVNVSYNAVAMSTWDPGTADPTLTYSFYHDTLLGGTTPFTWQNILDDLWGRINLVTQMGTSPQLTFVPQGTPMNFRFIGVSAWRAYNQVLERLGCALVYSKSAGTWAIVSTGGADAAIAATEATYARIRVYARRNIESVTATLPEAVTVMHHKLSSHPGTEPVTVGTGQWTVNQFVANDVFPVVPVVAAVSNTRAIIWDDLPALIDDDGSTIINAADISARDADRALSYYQTFGTQQVDCTIYAGYLPDAAIFPGPQVALTTWSDYGSGACTEVVKTWKKIRVDDAGSWSESGSFSEVCSWLRPPDVNRATDPNYPPQVQLVKVFSSSAEGPLLNYWPAHVIHRSPHTAGDTTLEPCYFTNLDNSTTAPDLTTIYAGKLNGTFLSGGQAFPLYVCWRFTAASGGGGGSSGNVIIAKLTGPVGGFYYSFKEQTENGGNFANKAGGITGNNAFDAQKLATDLSALNGGIVLLAQNLADSTDWIIINPQYGLSSTYTIISDIQCMNGAIQGFTNVVTTYEGHTMSVN